MFKIYVTAYANNNDALIPELWARESIAVLQENMVAANLVHRDFNSAIANFGDTVNTRKPAEFVAGRKIDGEDVTTQDASSTNIPVILNQHAHVSFLLYDGEMSKSFIELRDLYMKPAVLAQARFVDQVLLSQVHQFGSNYAGGLGLGSKTTVNDYIVDSREVMNINKVPDDGRRNMILTPGTESFLLKNELNVSAEKVGDDGSALRTAYLGKLYNFNLFQCQNTPSPVYRDIGTTAVGATAPAVGDTTFDAAASHGIVVGCFLKIAGDDQPQLVTGVSTNTITISPGFTKTAPAASAAIVRYMPGAVNLAAGYAAGWHKAIAMDAFSSTDANLPKVGQIVVFGSSSSAISGTAPRYTIISVTKIASGEVSVTLDRPLDAAIVDNALVAVGPTGHYNFAFHRNALSLVIRPLAVPMTSGVLAGSVNAGGFTQRVVITYDGKTQAHRVTLDFLMGVKVLDSLLGAVMYA